MSMWHLISGASVLVQLVMLALVLASIASWVLIFQRSAVTRAAKHSLDEFEDRFWSGIDLAKLYRQVTGNPNRSEEHTSELQSRPHLVCRLLLEKKKEEERTGEGA